MYAHPERVEDAGSARSPEPVAYDPDTRLLAFIGTLTLLVGSVFWVFVGLRLLVEGAPWAGTRAELAAVAALSLGPLGALSALMSWGLRAKMEAGEPVTAWEVRLAAGAGLVVGVVVGFVVFVALAYKLKDPGFLNVAGEPGNGQAGAR